MSFGSGLDIFHFERLKFIFSYVKGRILDVGCGDGLVTSALRNKGYDVVGIDPFNSASDYQISLSDAKSKGGVFEKPFDTIILSEVIEHSGIDIISQSLFFLKKGGCVIVTAPQKNILSYLSYIVIGEEILKNIPYGTHDYESFIHLNDLKAYLFDHHIKIMDICGFNPMKRSLCHSTMYHYLLYGVYSRLPAKQDYC